MNLQEAYQTLELPNNSSPEEAKKAFKKLAHKYHPDVNKETGSEQKFKLINEAYQLITSGKDSNQREEQWNPFAHYGNPFAGFTNFGNNKIHRSPIIVKVSISFIESVIGCDKDIKFRRLSKCTNCNGVGEYSQHNGCTTCNGKGQVVQRQGNMVFMQVCSKCNGKTNKNKCATCQAQGSIETEAAARVSIPPGILDGNTLRLEGLGHFAGSFGPLEQHTDVHLQVQVIPEPGLSIDGMNVVFTLPLSLQEALQGCQKLVKTIQGYQDIQVPSKSRHKEEILLPRLGVNKVGSQRIILDVQYPEDVSQLIEVLNQSLNYKVN
jgi:molecular chaperone DnaJ